MMMLTLEQEKVLAALSAGETLTAAAALADVHRNTITYWRQTSQAFNTGLRDAMFQKQLHWRDQAAELAAVATDALRATLTDPATPPAVRLKAALAVLDKATAPLDFPEPPPIHPLARIMMQQEAQMAELAQPKVSEEKIVHKNAQITAPPKPGRNELCPCGSGKKFKRCCLDKPASPPPSPPNFTDCVKC